jgi:RNA polymerase sigma factor (sigma-70 family)
VTGPQGSVPDADVPLARPVAADDALQLVPVPESFDRFYVREYRGLVALAYALTGSRGHAEDTAQEAMLVALRRWDDVGRLDSPAGWVRRVCANLATSFVRRRVVEARAMLRVRPRPNEVAELGYDDGEFWAAVRRLPRRQAQCIALTYVYGCPVVEIAEVLGCAEGTVKAHLARGRDRLASHLDEDDKGSRR